MTWLALLLVGCAVSDLVHTRRSARVLPDALGAVVVVTLGLAAGLTGAAELGGLVLVATGVIAWARTVTWGFTHDRAWLPLTVLAVLVLAGLAASATGTGVHGLLGPWWDSLTWPLVDGVEATRALLVLGAALVQLSTGNVVVRLVLSASGTLRDRSTPADGTGQGPATPTGDAPDEVSLQGGRLLGPMERLLILGLGLAGNLTAASIVVAAKGLLRFPELQSRREQQQIHRLTEYFLVGSFISWLLALGSLALLAG